MTAHRLSRRDARRTAVQAQLLQRRRPGNLLAVVRGLTLLQIDPNAAIAPSADLVVWSRLGAAYSPCELVDALEEHTLVDFMGLIRPAEDMALYGAEMAEWPGRGELRDWEDGLRDWVRANDRCRRDILERLDSSGPLTMPEIPDSCAVPWRSTGWTNNQNVTKLLGFMAQRGEVAVCGRKGRHRLWDLAERVYPDDPIVPYDEAARRRDEKRLRALGIARSTGTQTQVEPVDVHDVGEPAEVVGVAGEWRVDPTLLDQPFSGRAALLSPYDRLVHDRKRMEELFDFDYQLEVYKPAAGRRWGYYALPILYGDRLVGKLDAKADRKAGFLRVFAVHEDTPFSPTMRAAVDAEIADLALWLGLEELRPG